MKEDQAIQRLRQVLRRQHKALATEDAYVLWLRRYMKALCQMPPEFTSEKKLEKFLTDLVQQRDVSASTQNQALNAILFFYQQVIGQTLGNIKALRATRPVHERRAPTLAETQALLQTIGKQGGYPTNLIARMIYGCGLRVCEPLNLRIKDVDLERRRLWIRGAKGAKDRVVALPLTLQEELARQIQLARVVWERDKQDRVPLMLPHALARKYPAYQFSWSWAWLFPAHETCRDPRSGMIVRYRVHEANVQRAVKQASRQLGICVLPHELRHHSECRIIPSIIRDPAETPTCFEFLIFPTRNNQRACRNASSLSLGRYRVGRPLNGTVFANACSLRSRSACV